MKCELCHKNDAETVIYRVENGAKREMYVCAACAAKESHPPRTTFPRGRARPGKESQDRTSSMSVTITGNGEPPPFIEALLSATADLVHHMANEDEQSKDIKCRTCGTKWSEVEANGSLGCPDCWSAFAKRLGPRLQATQRKVAHVGKSPEGASGDRKHLERQLREAIRKEDYKAAAKLRDALNALDDKEEGAGK